MRTFRLGSPGPLADTRCGRQFARFQCRFAVERGWLMSIHPDLQVPVATAQAIVDGILVGRTVTAVSNIHGGEIAAIYEIAFVDAQPSVILRSEEHTSEL